MTLVYIAGPYREDNDTDRINNITAAKLAALDLARMRIPYICPHMNSAMMDVMAPEIPESFWLEMGIEQLSKCDAMFVY